MGVYNYAPKGNSPDLNCESSQAGARSFAAEMSKNK